jgi:hypothetical protein
MTFQVVARSASRASVPGQRSGQVRDLSEEFTGQGRGLVVLGLEVHQELGDTHAASSRVSRQDGLAWRGCGSNALSACPTVLARANSGHS